MKRRRHRIVVEVTATKDCTEKRAGQLLGLALDHIFLYPETLDSLGITKIGRPMQFSRVHQAASRLEKNS